MEPRTVIVGDVHGCSEELEELIEQVGYRPQDCWVFVGDLIARGPDTRGVLRLVRSLGAQVVLGNHEQRLLEVRDARRIGLPGPKLGPGHEQVLKTLEEHDWAVLEGMRPWLELPEHSVLVVHAGLDARKQLSEQKLEVLTKIRSIEGGEPTERFSERSWAETYEGPTHVVFGHNARLGLRFYPFATGVDSGCVYGQALSALVLNRGERPAHISERKKQVVQVQAQKAYYFG